jgi:hypothetical protein
MATKRLTLNTNEPVALRLHAGYAQVKVRVVPGTPEASIVLTGGQNTLDKVTERREGVLWDIRIPNEGAGGSSIQINSFSGGSHVTTRISGNARGIIAAGDMVIGEVRMGPGVHVGGGAGRVTVDGVDVTSYVREQRSSGAVEDTELTAEITLPAASSAILEVTEGEIHLTGDIEQFRAETDNAPVTVNGAVTSGMIKTHNGDILVKSAYEITLETHNGSIDLDDAHGQTMVTTHNGSARVHATADVSIMATSHNGNVDITKAPGTNPRVMASTHNGRVRKP